LAVLLLGRDFITLWMGKAYEDAYIITAILICARMCGFPTSSMYSMLYGIGKHHIILFTGMFEALLNLGLSLYLVRRIGVAGVAWGTLIPMFVGNVLFVLVASRQTHVTIVEWLKGSMLQPAPFCAVFLGLSYYYCGLFEGSSWPVFILQGCGVVAIYGLLLLPLGLKKRERIMVRARLAAVLALIRGGIITRNSGE
jgi:O-antigen/teichoic acid export membrane protein